WPAPKLPTGSSGSVGFRATRNHRTSIGAPRSWTCNPASRRTVECRPSQPSTRSHVTSSGPWSVRALAPMTLPSAVQSGCRLGLRHQLEIRVASCLGCKEVEKVPLRHERDELGPRRQVREIGESGLKTAETAAQAVRLGMRALQERVVETKLVQ